MSMAQNALPWKTLQGYRWPTSAWGNTNQGESDDTVDKHSKFTIRISWIFSVRLKAFLLSNRQIANSHLIRANNHHIHGHKCTVHSVWWQSVWNYTIHWEWEHGALNCPFVWWQSVQNSAIHWEHGALKQPFCLMTVRSDRCYLSEPKGGSGVL